MKLAVIGSRRYSKPDQVRAFVRSMPADWEIISGGAEGVDMWAVEEAIALQRPCHAFFPRLDQYTGNAALFERNKEIAYEADIAVGFWDGQSTGTLDLVRRMASLNKRTILIQRDDDTLPTATQLAEIVGSTS